MTSRNDAIKVMEDLRDQVNSNIKKFRDEGLPFQIVADQSGIDLQVPVDRVVLP